MKLSLWQRLLLQPVLALTWLLAWLPRPLNLGLGDLAGWLFYHLSSRRRNIALDNIQGIQALGTLGTDLTPPQIALGSFKSLGRTALESFSLMHRGLEYFKNHLSLIGGDESLEKLIQKAKDNGPGVIFLTAHSGNWELSTAAVPQKFGLTLSVVGRSQGWLANELLNRIRTKGGGEFIFKDGGAKDMLKLLRQGGFLGTLFDQADIVGSGGAKLMFLGKPAVTTLGPLRLAARTGASLVPLFCRRAGDRHIIEVSAPIAPPPDPKDRQWLMTTAQALNDLLADFVRRHPDQWMWSHRRWKMPERFQEDDLSPEDSPARLD